METAPLTTPADAAARPAPAADDPLWYKDAVIYEAHVKSFFDSNNDGVGDFAGLTQKLDYLQSLGITCVWLLPFFPSPLKDDGYDISDYLNVHPSYGTLDDFKAFIRAAHERHIKVLIELVVNHTSDQHPWFQRARHAPAGSPERDFYVWSDTDKKFAGTPIIFLDTEKSNWAFDPVAGQYYWHRFFSHQPDLNHNNPAVVDAVIGVMKFWLDLGVDALRLDAVPYLCVREGTTNENLPETHAVLKRMRRELDAAYANRMLLAEANEWPADVRAYFGDGDECHMAFHFPLMPRMFLALRQEDRHAITEILSQTPDIPETCQWALFLRNHDELTLSMVTDEERDYMYSVYASDPQMRLNLGIRRRLAPLVENSRRRVELLTSLLFSLPGTPIVYYGDEIGMGDNVYLGDRNGVRTPMQWTSDRNGGFSRADPARLFAPPIMDPVYGYQSINVEAQERSPFSLLNWMKRLIAMRKQHRVFGRGALEFAGCPNRKILAFLRRDDRETILVVSNLSRSVQPAELDLKAFAGLIPVEMRGLTEFPPITGAPYFLTLGPYASYWFSLQREPMQVAPRAAPPPDPAAAIADALPTLLVGPEWQGILDSGTRAVIERQALVPFLRRQPWLASSPGAIRSARFVDWTALRDGAHPAFLTIVAVDRADGGVENYVLPLALLAGDDAGRALKQGASAVVARITGARRGAIVDGWHDQDTCDRTFELIGRSGEQATSRGGVLRTAGIDLPSERTWTAGSADCVNSVAFANARFALTLFRRAESGTAPAVEIARFLTERGFPRALPLVGSLEYHRPGLDACTLAMLQTTIDHQGSAWDHAIDELKRYYERVAARVVRPDAPMQDTTPGSEATPFFTALAQWYLVGAATLGKRTAELHLQLAGGGAPPFSPEPLDAAALDELAREMRAHGEASLDLLARGVHDLKDPARAQAERVLASRDTLLAYFDEVGRLETAGMRIPVHGDYHLGQVLRAEEDFVIVNFGGDPSQPPEKRRARQSPLKDVAAMMRSYSYAAYAELLVFAVHAPDQYAVLEPWADTWQRSASDAFLRSYMAAVAGSGLAPDERACAVLLRAFTLDKALHELEYEIERRPDWVAIPLASILRLHK